MSLPPTRCAQLSAFPITVRADMVSRFLSAANRTWFDLPGCWKLALTISLLIPFSENTASALGPFLVASPTNHWLVSSSPASKAAMTVEKINYHPQSGWFEDAPLKG